MFDYYSVFTMDRLRTSWFDCAVTNSGDYIKHSVVNGPHLWRAMAAIVNGGQLWHAIAPSANGRQQWHAIAPSEDGRQLWHAIAPSVNGLQLWRTKAPSYRKFQAHVPHSLEVSQNVQIIYLFNNQLIAKAVIKLQYFIRLHWLI